MFKGIRFLLKKWALKWQDFRKRTFSELMFSGSFSLLGTLGTGRNLKPHAFLVWRLHGDGGRALGREAGGACLRSCRDEMETYSQHPAAKRAGKLQQCQFSPQDTCWILKLYGKDKKLITKPLVAEWSSLTVLGCWGDKHQGRGPGDHRRLWVESPWGLYPRNKSEWEKPQPSLDPAQSLIGLNGSISTLSFSQRKE